MLSRINTIWSVPGKGLAHALCVWKERQRIAPHVLDAVPFDHLKKRIHPQACCVLCEQNIHLNMRDFIHEVGGEMLKQLQTEIK